MSGVFGESGVALKRSNTTKPTAVLLSPVVLASRASVPTAVLSVGVLFSSAK